MEAPPGLALLLFFGTLLVLPQSSHGATRYYTFNVKRIFKHACMAFVFLTFFYYLVALFILLTYEVLEVDDQVNDVMSWVNSCVCVCVFVQVTMQNVTRLCTTRAIPTVNGKFPGPKIVTREGDRVIVKVVNNVKDNVTIHW